MAEVQKVKVADQTGTVPPMGRAEIEVKLSEMMKTEGAEISKMLPPDQKQKAEEMLKKVQAFISMFNMWMNAMIADIAATTVFSIENQYNLGDWLSYQTQFNAAVGEKLDALAAQQAEILKKLTKVK